MTVFHTLCLPILLSSVLVFLVSFILHMALPWHRKDYKKVPDQDRVMDALRPFGIPAGDYMLPRADAHSEMKTPEFKEKFRKGPVVVMTVFGSDCSMAMGKSLLRWFIYILVVSYFAAYVTLHTAMPGEGRRQICRIAGITAFLAYSGALWQMWIWYRRSLCTTIKSTIDAAIYGAVTALTLAYLWPH